MNCYELNQMRPTRENFKVIGCALKAQQFSWEQENKVAYEIPYQINFHREAVSPMPAEDLASTVIQALIRNSEEYSAQRRREAEIAYYSSQEFFDWMDEYAERRWRKKRKKKNARKAAKKAKKLAKKARRRLKEARRAEYNIIKMLEDLNE